MGRIWAGGCVVAVFVSLLATPAFARFLQTDPVGYKDDLDVYTYVRNDPANKTDPSGRMTSCSNGYCVMTTDGFDQSRSNNQTTVTLPGVKPAADAQAGKVKSYVNEKQAAVVPGPDGKPTVEPIQSTTSSSGGSSRPPVTKSTAHVPGDALALLHGHIEGAANGMVDVPAENAGYGDTQSLSFAHPLAEGTELGGQVGWHEIVNGQLRFSFPDGALTSGQSTDMQNNLNAEQTLFYR